MDSPAENPNITVPLETFQGLLDRIQGLENIVLELGARLGGVMLDGVGTMGETPTNPAAVAARPNVLVPQVAGGVVNLFSRLDVETARQFSEYEADVRFKMDLLAALHETTSPYTSAFMREMFSRVDLSSDKAPSLPPRPSFAEAPEEYDRYVKKYGKKIQWQELEGTKTHTFSLIYLPGEIAPDLVEFKILSAAEPYKDWNGTFTTSNQATFTFANSEMVGLTTINKRDAKLSRQGKQRVKITTINLLTWENLYQFDLTTNLAFRTRRIENDETNRDISYRYDLAKRSFVAGDNPAYLVYEPNGTFFRALGTALETVPRTKA